MEKKVKIEREGASNDESRRITREAVETAMVLLLEKKPFDKISVTELTEKAGVSRTAYYRNYETKEAVIYSILESSAGFSRLFVTDFRPERIHENWKQLFASLLLPENELILRLLANVQGEVLLRYVNGLYGDSPGFSPYNRYMYCFWAGGIFNVLREWASQGKRQSPEEMAGYMTEAYRLAPMYMHNTEKK